MTKEKNTPISNEIKIMQSHLQELRKIAGWSADELGQKMGMTRQAINSMEKNNPSTTMNQVHYLALIHLFTSECENNKKNKALATVLNMLFNDPDQYQKNKAEIDKNIKKLAAINKKDLSDEEPEAEAEDSDEDDLPEFEESVEELEPEQEEIETLEEFSEDAEDEEAENAEQEDCVAETEEEPAALEESVVPDEMDTISELDNLDNENFDSLEEEIPAESEELLSLPSIEDQLGDIDSEEENLQEFESMQGNSFSVSNAVSEIKNAINDQSAYEKYKKISEMLIHLKSLVAYLPDEERLKFLRSKERLQLDYVIAKLQGKPGLLSVCDACRRELDEDAEFMDMDDEIGSESSTGRSLAMSVLEHIRTMTKGMSDYEIADTLDAQISELLNKL